MKCRYVDCPEQHPVAADNEAVTCQTCRAALGLPVPQEPRVLSQWKPPKSEYDAAIEAAMRVCDEIITKNETLAKSSPGGGYPNAGYDAAQRAEGARDVKARLTAIRGPGVTHGRSA